MNNIEKYSAIFCEALEVENKDLEGLKYQDVIGWDSIGHMNLISELEEGFDIMLETDDIVDFSSFEKGMEILKEKYGIQF
ncbi:acyl carrier protein [Flavobacterium aquiphilum]|uniref:acyl carrier protein n=1 Tax=Flavobacterium aquiphilum TaxID=3003261 RepID=UPI002480AF4C|nr:acyl carrier protein [Flavobacterium aquiphilum]